MTDREDVIQALEKCIKQDTCDQCRYYGICGEEEDAMMPLLKDALALLKAQQPRALTLEEVFEKSKHIDDCFVFVEYYSDNLERDDKPDLEPCFIHNEKSYFEKEYHIVSVFRGGACMCFLQSYYGETWRCWTSRPTDEQRKAAKWE